MPFPERPNLRVVQPGESLPPESEPDPLPPPPSPGPAPAPLPSPESIAFGKWVDQVDQQVPRNACYLVCAGCTLADGAVAFYHQAVAHAPPGTFRRDIPPGLKSAEATRAWLETHRLAIKQNAREHAQVTSPYAGVRDLAQAAAVAGRELDRAMSTAKTAGLWFEERCAGLFATATKILTSPPALPTRREKVVGGAMADYVLGTDVLGAG